MRTRNSVVLRFSLSAADQLASPGNNRRFIWRRLRRRSPSMRTGWPGCVPGWNCRRRPEERTSAFPYRLALKRVNARESAPGGSELHAGRNGRRRGKLRVGASSRGKNHRVDAPEMGLRVARSIAAARANCFIRVREKEISCRKRRRARTAWPTEIDLSGGWNLRHRKSIRGGHIILLTTADQIADLSAFNFSGVLQATRGGPEIAAGATARQRRRKYARGEPYGACELVDAIHADSERSGGKTLEEMFSSKSHSPRRTCAVL